MGTRAGSGRIGSLGRPAGLQLCRAAGRHRRCLRVGHRLPRRALLRSRLRHVRELFRSRRDSARRDSRVHRWDGPSRSGARRRRARRRVDAQLARFRRRCAADFSRCRTVGDRGRVGVGCGLAWAKPSERCVLGRPRGGPARRCGLGRSGARCVVRPASGRVVRPATRRAVRSVARRLSRFAGRCDRDVLLLRRRRGLIPISSPVGRGRAVPPRGLHPARAMCRPNPEVAPATSLVPWTRSSQRDHITRGLA